MSDYEQKVESALIAHMTKMMLETALDETITEEERTVRLRRGRQYISAGGRADKLVEVE